MSSPLLTPSQSDNDVIHEILTNKLYGTFTEELQHLVRNLLMKEFLSEGVSHIWKKTFPVL